MRAISITEPADILTTLSPALIRYATAELLGSGQDATCAADLAQSAMTRWLEVVTIEDRARLYMRRTIRGMVADLKREGRDAMSHQPLSLDTLEA